MLEYFLQMEKNTPEKAGMNEIKEIVLERDQEKEREYDIKFKRIHTPGKLCYPPAYQLITRIFQ